MSGCHDGVYGDDGSAAKVTSKPDLEVDGCDDGELVLSGEVPSHDAPEGVLLRIGVQVVHLGIQHVCGLNLSARERLRRESLISTFSAIIMSGH